MYSMNGCHIPMYTKQYYLKSNSGVLTLLFSSIKNFLFSAPILCIPDFHRRTSRWNLITAVRKIRFCSFQVVLPHRVLIRSCVPNCTVIEWNRTSFHGVQKSIPKIKKTFPSFSSSVFLLHLFNIEHHEIRRWLRSGTSLHVSSGDRMGLESLCSVQNPLLQGSLSCQNDSGHTHLSLALESAHSPSLSASNHCFLSQACLIFLCASFCLG